MAFTTPATSTAGTVLTASYLNTYVRDNVAWMATDSPTCRVYNSAAVSIANNTVTSTTYDSERFDNSAMHSTSANTGRITVPSGGGGKYLVGLGGEFASNSSGERAMFIRLNGTTDIGQSRTTQSGGANWGQTILTVYAMSAADYAEARVFQNSGGALNWDYQANRSPEFYAFWFRN